MTAAQLYSSGFPKLFSMEETLKYFFISQESPTNGNENETKEAVVSVWRLITPLLPIAE
jgi:hypothetical protein